MSDEEAGNMAYAYIVAAALISAAIGSWTQIAELGWLLFGLFILIPVLAKYCERFC